MIKELIDRYNYSREMDVLRQIYEIKYKAQMKKNLMRQTLMPIYQLQEEVLPRQNTDNLNKLQ